MENVEERTLLTAGVLATSVTEGPRAAGLFDPGGLETLKRKPKPPPKPNITATVTAGPSASGLVTVTGKTYAKAKVTLEFVATGAALPRVKANAKGVYRISFTVGIGSTLVKLSATAPGHKPTSTTLTVNRPDTVPPVLTLGALSPGPLTRTEETITGNVSDAIAGVKSLTALLDGQSSPISFNASGNFSYTTALPLNGSADGTHTLQLVAVDGAGNMTVSTVETFTLVTRPPVITVSSPASGAVETGNFVVSGQVTDAESVPVNLTEALDGGPRSPSR